MWRFYTPFTAREIMAQLAIADAMTADGIDEWLAINEVIGKLSAAQNNQVFGAYEFRKKNGEAALGALLEAQERAEATHLATASKQPRKASAPPAASFALPLLAWLLWIPSSLGAAPAGQSAPACSARFESRSHAEAGHPRFENAALLSGIVLQGGIQARLSWAGSSAHSTKTPHGVNLQPPARYK